MDEDAMHREHVNIIFSHLLNDALHDVELVSTNDNLFAFIKVSKSV